MTERRDCTRGGIYLNTKIPTNQFTKCTKMNVMSIGSHFQSLEEEDYFDHNKCIERNMVFAKYVKLVMKIKCILSLDIPMLNFKV